MERILVTIGERFSPEAKAVLAMAGSVTCERCDRKKLLKLVKDTTLLVVGLEHQIDSEIFAAAKSLKLVATATTGLNHIDLEEAKYRRIKVVSLRDNLKALQSVTSTAELALGLMLSLVRSIPSATAAVKNKQWNRNAFEGHSLNGKTLGIVGLGRLGSMMANYGKALRMEVIYCDIGKRNTDAKKRTFGELLKESDIISIHAPFNDTTKGMFDTAALKKMKQGAYLINTARGEIVDEQAVIDALDGGKLAGYAADVVIGETTDTNPPSSKLITYARKHDNVIVTPHIGGMTVESRSITDKAIAKAVLDALGM